MAEYDMKLNPYLLGLKPKYKILRVSCNFFGGIGRLRQEGKGKGYPRG
jgi:hypothetical protein